MPINPLDYPLAMMTPQLVTGLSAWGGHIPFAFSMIQMLQPRTIVELGTHGGDSYCAFCQAVAALKLPTRCWAVDTWQGDAHTGQHERQILAQLHSYHDPLYGNFSQLIEATFDQALSRFDDNSIDLLHIDGLHTYEAVRHDFETWLPKISSRGVVMFHDIAAHEADFGVWKLWEEISGNWPHFSFEHSSGLGVLAVGKEVPQAVLGFLAEASADPAPVRAYFAYRGNFVEQLRNLNMLSALLAQQQLLIDGWKKQAGRSDAASTNLSAAITDRLGFAKRLSEQIESILKEDLAIRA